VKKCSQNLLLVQVKIKKRYYKRGDSRTSHVQQGYNTPLTWGGPHTL